MKSVISTLFLALTLCSSAIASERLNLDYKYQGTYPADFSGMSDGPLSIGEFVDARGVGDSALIHIGEQTFTLDRPLGDYIREAFIQALSRAHAELSTESSTTVSGTITEFTARYTDSGIEVIIRCDAVLNARNRNAWQSALFSRAVTDTTDIAEAVGAALDRLARELLVDDYFRIELGIF